MRTLETTVYQFDELSDSAKETARQWYRDASQGDNYFAESVIEDAATNRRPAGAEPVEVLIYAPPSVTRTGGPGCTRVLSDREGSGVMIGAAWIVRALVAGVVAYALGQAINREYVELASTVQQARERMTR